MTLRPIPGDPDAEMLVYDDEPFCAWGWKTPHERGCNYTGGCVCLLSIGHPGRCKCEMCGSVKERPKDWDVKGRAEANA